MFFTFILSAAQVDESQKVLTELKTENIELKGIIDKKNKIIVVLEGQLKTQDQKYVKDLSEKESNLVAVVKELEKKSDTIAYLTSQLHNSKIRQSGRHHQSSKPSSGKNNTEVSKESQETRLESTTAGENGSSHTDISAVISSRTPVPPREGTPSNVQRRYRRSTTSPVPQSLGTKMKTSRAVGIQASPNEIQLNVAPVKSAKGMPLRSKRASSPSRPGLGISKGLQRSTGRDRPLPDDYVEFLRTGTRPDPQVVVRAAPEPLPPISANERLATTPKSPYTGRVQMNRGHSSQGVPAAIYADGTTAVEDVGKIIVSPLSSPEKGWRHKQQSQQQNGPD